MSYTLYAPAKPTKGTKIMIFKLEGDQFIFISVKQIESISKTYGGSGYINIPYITINAISGNQYNSKYGTEDQRDVAFSELLKLMEKI